MQIVRPEIAGPLIQSTRAPMLAARKRARAVLERITLTGLDQDPIEQLLRLLRSRDYSIADLIDDIAAAKDRQPPELHPRLDDTLGLCLKATAAVHEAAIETMLHGFCELDAAGRITYANGALLDMVPECEGELLAGFLELDQDWLRSQLAAGVAKRAHRLEFHSARHSGPVLVELGPLSDGLRGGFALITDLTPEQEEKRRIDDMAKFAILRLDADSRITYANESACRILHANPEDIVGLTPADFIVDKGELKRVNDQTEERRKGVSTEYDVRIQPVDVEAPLHIRVRSMPEMDPDGHLSSIFVTLAPIDAEMAAERIQEALATADDPDALFTAAVGYLKSALPFGYATLSVYSQAGKFSRLLNSVPQMDTNQRWVPMPESVERYVAMEWTTGADIREFLGQDPDRRELAENMGVRELVDNGMRSWASVAVRTCDCHAVFTVMHETVGYYDDESVQTLEKTGVLHAMRRVLKLQEEQDSAFRLSLIKEMAEMEGDLALADLVVRALADYYGWQNVSLFKVNALHNQFELLTQACASRDGFCLPENYQQPIDTGILGKSLREGDIKVVSDANEERMFVRGSALTRSEMCVPIRVKGRIAWILNIEDRRPYAFGDPDKGAVERLMRELEPSLERALSTALLVQVLEDAPDGVVITDFESRILKCNRAAAAMFGGPAEGRNLADFFAAGTAGAEVARRARSERTIPIDAMILRPDGTKAEVLMRSRVPRDEYERRVVVLQDRQKIDWQAEMRRLAAVTSEARVPLSLISTFVRHIGKITATSNPDVAQLADHAIRQLARVELTYDRLLESGSKGRRSKVSIFSLLSAAVAELPPLQRELVRLKPTSGSLPLIRCERSRLQSALESMLAYMLRIGEAGGPISARLRSANSTLELRLFKPRRVTDASGNEIDPQHASVTSEASALAALDEPKLFQLAALQGGRFSRRRGAHGETLRLVLAIKGVGHV